MLFRLSYILFNAPNFINKLYGIRRLDITKYNIPNYLNKNFHNTKLFLGKNDNDRYDDIFNFELNEKKKKKKKEKNSSPDIIKTFCYENQPELENTTKDIIPKKFGNLKKDYIPKTENQILYKKSLNDKNINLLFCTGPAGSGKTLFACVYAIELLKKNIAKKIVITRPMITIEEDMGYLPGDIKNKMHPWTIPIFDVFEEYYTKSEINTLIQENIIEIAPLGFMQGRTFKNAVVIADEMQNSTPLQMFMLATRIGNESKMIITGDLMQTKNTQNGLNDIITKINDKYKFNEDHMIDDGINIVKMGNSDIQRHKIVYLITNLYGGDLNGNTPYNAN